MFSFLFSFFLGGFTGSPWAIRERERGYFFKTLKPLSGVSGYLDSLVVHLWATAEPFDSDGLSPTVFY